MLALKVWNIKNLDKENALQIAQKFNIPTFLAMLIDIYDIDDIEDFIRPNFEKSSTKLYLFIYFYFMLFLYFMHIGSLF